METNKISKAEINEICFKLNKTSDEKELWFKKKEELKTDLKKEIAKIKELKLKKDNSSLSLQSLFKEREQYNKKVKELIVKIKPLNQSSKDPLRVQEIIEQLEKKIEHESLTLEQEQKVMKQIKVFKRELKGSTEVQDLSKGINEAKNKAEEAHKKILEFKKEDGAEYNEFLQLSKKIEKLKIEQEDAFKKFIESKMVFTELNNELKEKLKQVEPSKPEVSREHRNKELKEREVKEKIEQKQKQVEEKLKTKKRLTTEDLMAFQEIKR